MTEDNAITVTSPDRLRTIMRSPDVFNRFAEVLGQHNASAYVTSVLLAVANNRDLQTCTPGSLITSAMRAATLRLSCDPATKQAHLVPYKGKATLIVGHKGYYDMAQRTGRYRYLNDFKVYEGQTVEEDQLRGTVEIVGHRTSTEVIGYGFYFELINGLKKVLYMTVAEIEEHGAKYSPTFHYKGSIWKTNFDAMAKKTVIRLCLSRYGYLDPNDAMALNAIDDSDGEDTDYQVLPQPRRSINQNLTELGFDPEPEDTRQIDPDTGEITEAEFRDTEPEAEPAPKPWTNTVISLETAKSEKSSEGKIYWEMETPALTVRLNSLNKSIKDNHLSDGDRETKMLKRDVIKAIVEYRQQML